MKGSEFYEGVTHFETTWNDIPVCAPTFYYDVRMLTALFLVPLERARALLPSASLHPLRVTPWHSVIQIAAIEYRDSDIGPYNEVGMTVPVSIGRRSPLFTGLLLPAPVEPDGYIWQLPVTSQIARDLGIVWGAYPKFLADIEFIENDDWLACRVAEAGQHILTLSVRKGQLRQVPRYRTHPLTVRGGRLLRPLVIYNERQQFTSRRRHDAKLELGDHKIAQDLRDLGLGMMAECSYTPSMETILTTVLESFPA